jgi:hypothetical protein
MDKMFQFNLQGAVKRICHGCGSCCDLDLEGWRFVASSSICSASACRSQPLEVNLESFLKAKLSIARHIACYCSASHYILLWAVSFLF